MLRANRLGRRRYAEPFAGGCGLALALLFENVVGDVHINDIDKGVFCFWQSVLHHTDDLVALVSGTPVTVDEWQVQRDVYLEQDDSDPITLGFSTFFLNRTNRSGIVKGAGAIGGLAQIGKYKIGCRFNKDDLVERIRRVAKYRDRIHLSGLDAIAFIRQTDNEKRRMFLFVDPPYFSKGSSLYTNYYTRQDHQELAAALLALNQPWMLTYDDVTDVRELYRNSRQFALRVQYSVQTKRLGEELLVPSKGLRIPAAVRPRRARRKAPMKTPCQGEETIGECANATA